MTELKFFWARLNANYWFYPALFAILAAALAFIMIWLDRNGWAGFLNDEDWLIPARPNGASDMLTVMAGSMIGVASTVFSITIAAVAYASGNYGPRLLTNFMEDRGNQLSLATFIATFVYALVVLRSVRSEDETATNIATAGATSLPGFTPQLSLLVAYGLMAISIAVLVFFLNHIPNSIRVNKVLQGIGTRLLAAIKDTYPIENDFVDAREAQGGDPIVAEGTGYIQLIDFMELKEIAEDNDATISLIVRTGDFVHRNMPLLNVRGCDPDDIAKKVQRCITLGPTRTPDQDPQFLMDELVEIGLRALSPGINDPFTAITALHWLGAATAEIGQRDLRKDICADGETQDNCPVIPRPDSFQHFADRGFGSIRSGVATNASASEIMLQAIEHAAYPIGHRDRVDILRYEAQMLAEQARLALAGPDLDIVEARYRAFQKRLTAKV